MNKAEVISALSALAHPVRIEVFRTLVTAGPGGLTPSVLNDAVDSDLKQSTLSTHLKELMAAGLITNERAGRHVVYRAAYQQMNGVLAYLTENCCKGISQDVDANSTSVCQP